MKKTFKIFMVIVLIFSLMIPVSVFAVGDGNIDSGGEGMESGTSDNKWSHGCDGVRITVVRANDHAIVTTPIDFTNKQPPSTMFHFGKVSKIQYKNGRSLSAIQGSYSYYNPAQAMPRIVSTNGSNNIDSIKKYFCSEYTIQRIADITGMDYDILLGGEYKLLLEPMAY